MPPIPEPTKIAPSAWNPGVVSYIPKEFRCLETIFSPDCVFSSAAYLEEIQNFTGLQYEELTVFRPERLALHELIVRVNIMIAISEGAREGDFGRNFREIVSKIWIEYVLPQREKINGIYDHNRAAASDLVSKILTETIFNRKLVQASSWRQKWNPLRKPASIRASRNHGGEFEFQTIQEIKRKGLAAREPLRQAVYKSLYRVLGSILAVRGHLGNNRALLERIATEHVCNNYGSQLISEFIAPLLDVAIDKEGYRRIPNRQAPILISLKGPSAAGKSSIRPMLQDVMRAHGMERDGYVIISPDVWRRLLLDFNSLGSARKYAGHLTSRELMVIDGKLDRRIRAQANHDSATPHFLVDRFRFDSFSSDQIERVLQRTYAKYVDTMYMYFVITPPEETVERGWRRALERGRYKAVGDFLGYSVEAYSGVPKILFKWLAFARPAYRFVFLDNRVPKGTFPSVIAFGAQGEMTIYDVVGFTNIERYQKININARTAKEVYEGMAAKGAARHTKFLRECIQQIAVVKFVDRGSGTVYVQAKNGVFEVLDNKLYARILSNMQVAEVFRDIAPGLSGYGA